MSKKNYIEFAKLIGCALRDDLTAKQLAEDIINYLEYEPPQRPMLHPAP